MSDAVTILVAVKAAANTLRLLANSLDSAADQAAAAPVAVLSEVDLRDWDLDELPLLPRQGLQLFKGLLVVTLLFCQVAATRWHDPSLHYLNIALTLLEHRAKATIEGKVSKPRPSPKIAQKATCYIILRGPGIAAPVRVWTALLSTSVFCLASKKDRFPIPSLPKPRDESIVYCLAAGVLFPEPSGQ